MAESPIKIAKITRSDDGLFVRCEFDAHYFSDEGVQRIRGYIDQLETENAKLRVERDEWKRVAKSKQDTIDHMRDANHENAKLRELVDILCFCMQVHKRCDDCKLNGAKGELGLGHDPLLACDGLHEMLKELGIEV